jgi:hypothetical protein
VLTVSSQIPFAAGLAFVLFGLQFFPLRLPLSHDARETRLTPAVIHTLVSIEIEV